MDDEGRTGGVGGSLAAGDDPSTGPLDAILAFIDGRQDAAVQQALSAPAVLEEVRKDWTRWSRAFRKREAHVELAAVLLPLAREGDPLARDRMRALLLAPRGRRARSRALALLEPWPPEARDDWFHELRADLALALGRIEDAMADVRAVDDPDRHGELLARLNERRDHLRIAVCEAVLRGLAPSVTANGGNGADDGADGGADGGADDDDLPPELVRACRRLHDVDSQHAHARELVEIHLRRGETDRALFHLQQFRPRGEDEGHWLLARRGLAWLRTGRLSSALRDVEMLLPMRWRGARREGLVQLYELAVAALERGLQHVARELLLKLLLVDAGHADALALFGRLEGEEDEAHGTRPLPSVSIARAFSGDEPVEAILADRYVLHRMTSRGARSTGWRATDEATGRRVFVETFRLDEGDDGGELRRRLERLEGEPLDGILPLVALVRGEARLDVVWEEPAGDDLASARRHDPSVIVRERVLACRSIAWALLLAGKRGLGHPGLHEEDVIRRGPGRWVIRGFATEERDRGAESALDWCHRLAPPEHLRGEALDEKGLVHNLGRLFDGDGESTPGTVSAGGDSPWRRFVARAWGSGPDGARENVLSPEDALFAAMTAFRPEDRPGYEELIARLDALLQGKAAAPLRREEPLAVAPAAEEEEAQMAGDGVLPSFEEERRWSRIFAAIDGGASDEAEEALAGVDLPEDALLVRVARSRLAAARRSRRIEALRGLLSSGSQAAALELASLLREDGSWLEAMEILQAPRRVEDGLVLAWRMLMATLFEERGFDALAVAVYEEMEPERFAGSEGVAALSHRGWLLERVGRPVRARQAYVMAMDLEASDDLQARIHRIDREEATLLEGEMALDGAGGATLDGRFEILSEIGAGGMGVVHRVRDVQTGEELALKRLTRRQARRAELVAAFLGEMRLLAGLEHEGIVRVKELHAAAERSWYTMEFLAGPSLAERLASGGPLAPGEFFRFAREILAALAHAHGRGIVHRDLSPDNLRWDRPGGSVKIIDFGLGFRPGTGSTQIREGPLGTARTVSPEQIEDGAVDGRSDVYSLGAVFYEALTGHPPFEEPSVPALLHAHLNRPPRPPSNWRPEIPPPLDRLVLRALEKEPSRRFDGAEAMLGAVEALARRWGERWGAPSVEDGPPSGEGHAL